MRHAELSAVAMAQHTNHSTCLRHTTDMCSEGIKFACDGRAFLFAYRARASYGLTAAPPGRAARAPGGGDGHRAAPLEAPRGGAARGPQPGPRRQPRRPAQRPACQATEREPAQRPATESWPGNREGGRNEGGREGEREEGRVGWCVCEGGAG